MEYGIDKKIIERIIYTMKWYKNIKTIILFGSRARGDYDKASDIDIAYETDNGERLIHLKDELQSISEVYYVDVVDINLAKDTPIYQYILKDGIVLYAKP